MRARDLMTPNPVTFQPGTPITVAARAMAERGFSGAPVETLAKAMEERAIRRIPVLRDGRLVGIVSRADLIRALLQPAEELVADAPDERIRRALAKAMKDQPWIDAFAIFFDVKDGVVSFHGYCRNDAVLRGLRVLAETVPGVRGVKMMVERTTLSAMAS